MTEKPASRLHPQSNEALKSSLQQADIEEAIRKVIREELKGRKAA
jgi:hypothetical protein